MFVTSLPVIFLLAQPLDAAYSWRDTLGYVLAVFGLICESVADQQKFEFRNDKRNDGHWCDTGLWAWSRHPNYFGELLVWWGIFSICANVFQFALWQYCSVIGPILLTASIFFFSGMTRLEESADKRYWNDAEYQQYRKQTSILILVRTLA